MLAGDARVRAVTDLPVALLLTHAHPDHYGAAGEFHEIWLHERDRAILPGMARLDEALGASPLPAQRVQWFDDRQTFDLGDWQLRVLPCPGHTPGSVLFVDDGQQAVFSGDALGSGYIVLMSIPGALSLAAYRQSLIALAQRLKGCADYTWYTGHYHQAGAPGTSGYEPNALRFDNRITFM